MSPNPAVLRVLMLRASSVTVLGAEKPGASTEESHRVLEAIEIRMLAGADT